MRSFQIFDGFIDQDSLDNLLLPVCELVIEPGDVVWVPRSPWEKAEEYLVQVVSAAAQAVAVYQGGRLIDSGSAQPATIGIQ